MTLYVPSITVDQVIEAVGAFIQPFVGDAQIVRGYANLVAPPTGPYVQLTEVGMYDLETPTPTGTSTQSNIATPARIDIQADFYGPASGDWCKAVKGVFRSSYSTLQFPDGIQPLYCSDGIPSPLITGEEQYDKRFVCTLSLQYNAVVSVPRQTATELSMNVIGDLP